MDAEGREEDEEEEGEAVGRMSSTFSTQTRAYTRQFPDAILKALQRLRAGSSSFEP